MRLVVVALLVLVTGPPLIWIVLRRPRGRRLAIMALAVLVFLSGFLVKRHFELNEDEAARAADASFAAAFGVTTVIPVTPYAVGGVAVPVPARGYVVEGRKLRVGYTHNPLCSLVRATAKESADSVTVTLADAPVSGSADCRAVPSIAQHTVWLVTLTLSADVGNRTVLDGASGQPISRKMVEK